MLLYVRGVHMRIASKTWRTSCKLPCFLPGTSGKEVSIKVKTDQGTQTGPSGAVGGTVKETKKDLLTAATGKDPATGEKFEGVACGSDSELLGDGKDKECRKKRRKKHRSKTGSSMESKKALKETGTDTFNEGENKGSVDPGKAPISEGGVGDGQVDSGGDKRDSRVTSEGGKEDASVNSGKNSKMDNGESKGDVKVDSKGVGPGGGEGKEEEPVARDSGDTETAAAGSGKKKLHACACCGLAETLAKTFKRCQK